MKRPLFAVGLIAASALLALVVATLAGPRLDGKFGTVGEIPNRVDRGPDRDVPCIEGAGTDPVCATPLPALTQAQRAAARPLAVASIEVPLDRLGSYRIYLGDAVLPGGVLEEASFALDNGGDGTYLAPRFHIELEDAATKSVVPNNVYAKGVQAGPQRVSAYLRFDVQRFDPGAKVMVSDIVVR